MKMLLILQKISCFISDKRTQILYTFAFGFFGVISSFIISTEEHYGMLEIFGIHSVASTMGQIADFLFELLVNILFSAVVNLKLLYGSISSVTATALFFFIYFAIIGVAGLLITKNIFHKDSYWWAILGSFVLNALFSIILYLIN